jgi:hypothetical protein
MATAVGGLLSLVLKNSFRLLQTWSNALIADNSAMHTRTGRRFFPRSDGKNPGDHALRMYHGAGIGGEGFVGTLREWPQATNS